MKEIPPELLVSIFEFLDFSDVIFHISQVCKIWRKVCKQSSSLWYQFCMYRWKLWPLIHDDYFFKDDMKIEQNSVNDYLFQYSDYYSSSFMYNYCDIDDSTIYLNDQINHDKQNADCKSMKQNLWFHIFIERYMKDSRTLKMLKKPFWTNNLEYLVMEEAQSMGLDIYEKLLQFLSQENSPSISFNSDYQITVKYCNLTVRYFGYKLLRKLHVVKVLKEWDIFLGSMNEDSLMIEGAILLCKLNDPFFDRSKNVDPILNQLIDLVRNHLKGQNMMMQNYGLASFEEKKEFISVINHVLYQVFGMHGNNGDYYDVDNCYIDKVLIRKKGIPITMCAIYQAICNEFGLFLDPMGVPGHFVLRMKKTKDSEGVRAEDQLFIDVFRQGNLITTSDLLALCTFSDQELLNQSIQAPCPLQKVYERMINNFITYSFDSLSDEEVLPALDLLLKLNPNNHVERVARIERLMNCGMFETAMNDITFLKQNISSLSLTFDIARLQNFISMMESISNNEIENRLSSKKPTPKLRRAANASSSDHLLKEANAIPVLYYVGLVIRHKKYGYQGVIFGWDECCTMPDAWIEQMGVDSLPLGRKQPFYNVMVHSSKSQITYVAQENIIIISRVPSALFDFSHPKVKPILEPEKSHTTSNTATTSTVGINSELHPSVGMEDLITIPMIQNREVGRHFEEFNSTLNYYIGNQVIQHIYPEDTISKKNI